MKVFSKIIFLFVATTFATFTLQSCDVEPIDSAVLDDIDDDNGNNDGGGVSTGDYWPMAINNQWVYKDETGEVNEPFKINSTAVLSGKTYYNYNSLLGQGDIVTVNVAMRTRKSSGNYYVKVEDITYDIFGFVTTMTGFEYIIFKDYLNVNDTWTGSYNQTISVTGLPSYQLNTTYTGKILELNGTVVVEGQTYTNVIKSEIKQTSSMTGSPATVVTSTYWFAKDVGLIKSITLDESENEETSLALVSYILN